MARTVVNPKDRDALSSRLKEINDDLYTKALNSFKVENSGEASFSDFINFFFYGIVPNGSLDTLNISEKVAQKMKYPFSIKGSIKNILKLNNNKISTVDIEERVDENNEKSYGFNIPFDLYLDNSADINTLDTAKLTNILNATLNSFLTRRSGLNKSDIKKYGTCNNFIDTVIKEYNKGLTYKEKIGSKSAHISREIFAKEVNKAVVVAIQDVNTKLKKESDRVEWADDEIRKIEAAKRREERIAIQKANKEKESAISILAGAIAEVSNKKAVKERKVVDETTTTTKNEVVVSSAALISCALIDSEGHFIETIKGKTIEQIKANYASSLKLATRVMFMGVTDSTGTKVAPLTAQMVDLCPNANVIEICKNVSKIADYAFVRQNINIVALRGFNNFDKKTGEFNWELNPNTLKSNNPSFKIVAGGRVGNRERYVASDYNKFMYEYYNGMLEKNLNAQIFTQTPDSKLPKITTEVKTPVGDGNNNQDNKTPEKIVVGSEPVDKPNPQPQPQRPASVLNGLKGKKNYMYPYQLDVHRHLNFGPGSLLRWSVKRPVWSTIAVTGALLGIAGIFSGVVPAFGAMFASIKIAAASIFVGGLLIAGAIQIGKQILKRVNKRYRSLFMKDKANKLNKKIAEKLRQVQNNITRSKSLMETEVGILEGNATKLNNPSLSAQNTHDINAAHKEYLQLIAKNKKLMKQVGSLQKEMKNKMMTATTLEQQIGGEGTQKCQDREKRLNEANAIIEYYKKASKNMGRLYIPDPTKGRGDGESTKNIIGLYEDMNGRGSANVGQYLDSTQASDISTTVKQRIDQAISQETNTEVVESVNFEGKEDFYNKLKEAHAAAHSQKPAKKLKTGKKTNVSNDSAELEHTN